MTKEIDIFKILDTLKEQQRLMEEGNLCNADIVSECSDQLLNVFQGIPCDITKSIQDLKDITLQLKDEMAEW